jgi:site-specific recombinase XerD
VTFRGAALTTGLPRELRPYDLRRLFASLLIKSGANVVEVASQLGHSATTTLGTYAHELETFVGMPPIDVEAEIRRARKAAA